MGLRLIFTRRCWIRRYCLMLSLVSLSSISWAEEIIQPNPTLTQSLSNQQAHQGRWVNAAELRPGMKLLLANNQLATLTNSWQPREQTETTYNFEVANDHTYFVGEQQLWVHNTCIRDIWRVDPDNIRVLTRVDNKGKKVFDGFEIDDAITDDNLGKVLEVVNLEILAKGGTINVKGSKDLIDRVMVTANLKYNTPHAVGGVHSAVLQRPTTTQINLKSELSNALANDADAIRATTTMPQETEDRIVDSWMDLFD